MTNLNPVLGILDTRSGSVHLALASLMEGNDHLSLVERETGFEDFTEVTDFRGFVITKEGSRIGIFNLSGLNPNENRMEPESFEIIERELTPIVEQCQSE